MPTKYQLKNGLNVLLVESHKSPVVSVQMWVKTGSADESKGIEGISHFIEHLVFKGTEKYGVGSIASAVEGSGGVLNAYTTFDQTVFYVTLSKSFVETGLDVISEMMGRPKFDSAEIDNEREVVIEEIKRAIDNPHQQASRLLFSNAYKMHPYGIPVIGYDENIRKLTREEIINYYESRYLPQNMNLVVVGDFKTNEMKKKLEQYFGSLKKKKLRNVARKLEPTQTKDRIEIKATEFNESYLYLSWPTTKIKHKDATALSVVAMILGQGESSRLVQKLRNDKQLVNSVGASTFSPKEQGFIALSASLNNSKLADVVLQMSEELKNFLAFGPTESELRRAINLIESDRYYSMETVDGLAGLYGHYEFLYNDYRYFERTMKELSRLTTKELVRVAKKYFQPNKMCVTYLMSGDRVAAEKILNSIPKMLSSRLSAKASPEINKKEKQMKSLKWSVPKRDRAFATEKLVLPSGARLVIKPMQGSPVVSVRYGFLGGLRVEDLKTPGANELTSRVWPASTKNLSEVQINQKIESMASGLGSFSGRNSMGLSLTALHPNFSDSLEIMNDILLNYSISENIVAREKQLMLEHIKSRADKPAQQCMRKLMSLMFEGHPYAKDPYGEAAEVEKLNEISISNQIGKSVYAENMVISVVGDIDKVKLKKIFVKLTEQLAHGAKKNEKFSLMKIDENQKAFIELNKAQTHIALAYRGLSFQDKDRFALELMQSILSGQGGRLFIELRDKESLAYSVSPIRMDGIEAGYFGAYIGCSPEKSEKAIKMLRAEFSKLGEILVSAEELERSKKYLLGRHDIALQKTGHVADLILFDELYGLDFKEFEMYNENIRRVTANDIREIARRIFSQKEVLSLVGKTAAG